jgi:hypothetical protein
VLMEKIGYMIDEKLA